MNTLALPVRGRPPKQAEVTGVRPIRREDLPKTLEPRHYRPGLQKIRDSHHLAAQLFAAGMDLSEISAATGYSIGRLSTLRGDPAFDELVAQKRAAIEAGRQETIIDNSLRAVRLAAASLEELQARLEDDPERFTNKELLAMASDAMDRTGPAKRQTNVNVNFDFADRLAAARRRAFGATTSTPRSSPDLVEGSGVVAVVPSDPATA